MKILNERERERERDVETTIPKRARGIHNRIESFYNGDDCRNVNNYNFLFFLL